MATDKGTAKRSDEDLDEEEDSEEEERDEETEEEEEDEESSDDSDEDSDDDEEDSDDEDEEEEESDKDSDDSDDSDEDDSDDEEPEPVAAKSAPKTPRQLGLGYSVRNIWTILLRELRSYFDSLVAYVVIGLSTLVVGAYFFLYQGGFWNVDRATMARMFDSLPFALCVVIPLVTMGVLADEKRSGTIELLITMPVKDSEVILGKYFAALGMCSVLLLATLLYPIAMFKFPWHLGSLDWGPIWSGYLGLFLMCSAGVAIGMWFSSITESNIIAFFATMLVLLALYAMGYLVEPLRGWMGDSLAFLSFQTRYTPFARGLIDTRNVVYFLSLATLGLLLSFRSLESRKWS
jgi:ABC-2 type transport system permease protein